MITEEKSKAILKDMLLEFRFKGRKFFSKQLISLFIALLLIIILSVFVKFTSITQTEDNVFYIVYHSPNKFGYIVSGIMQFGAVFFVIIAAAIALVYNRIKLSRDFVISGIGAWLIAKFIKNLVMRPRPIVLLHDVIARSEDSRGLGYPSGHMAVVSALGFILWPYLNKTGKVLTLVIITLVGLGRMYVGAHFPLDLLGGLLVGWFTSSLVYLVFRFNKVAKKEVLEEAYFTLSRLRIKKSNIRKGFYLLVSIIGVFVLIPFLNILPQVIKIFGHIRFIFLVPVIFFSFLTYVFAALAQKGAITDRLPFFELFLIQLGSSFTNRIIPAGLGGVGLNIKYLQKKNISNTATATSLAVKSFAAMIITLLLSIIALTISGDSLMDHIKINKIIIIFALIIVLIISLIIIFIKKIRDNIKARLIESFEELKKLHNSNKYLQLVIGSLGVTISYAIAFHFSCLAFNQDINIFNTFITYIIGTTVGSAFPTPGGLGGVEASLAGGLAVIGIKIETAIAIVLIYRIATFWIPTLFGGLSFFYINRKGLV